MVMVALLPGDHWLLYLWSAQTVRKWPLERVLQGLLKRIVAGKRGRLGMRLCKPRFYSAEHAHVL